MYKPPPFQLLSYVEAIDLWAANELAAGKERGPVLLEFERRVAHAHAIAGWEHHEWLGHRLALTRGWIDRRSRQRSSLVDSAGPGGWAPALRKQSVQRG